MKAAGLKQTALLLLLLLTGQSASAASATGASALALASLVAAFSPLDRDEKDVLMRLFGGNSNISFPAGAKIIVKADAVVCRSSNVDITSRSCKLSFSVATVDVTGGRLAHELYATIAEVGVPPDGAAGSVFESMSHLVCTIDPNVIAQKAGGGADCTFDPGGA